MKEFNLVFEIKRVYLASSSESLPKHLIPGCCVGRSLAHKSSGALLTFPCTKGNPSALEPRSAPWDDPAPSSQGFPLCLKINLVVKILLLFKMKVKIPSQQCQVHFLSTGFGPWGQHWTCSSLKELQSLLPQGTHRYQGCCKTFSGSGFKKLILAKKQNPLETP